MARLDPDDLHDPEQVYLAASLGAARDVERLLSQRGVDYVVQVEPLGRSSLFGSVRQGAAFYVASAQAQYCRSYFAELGLKGIVERAPSSAE